MIALYASTTTNLPSATAPILYPVEVYAERQAAQAAASPTEKREEVRQQNDETLILAIRHGVEQAMEILYQRYSRYAYTLAYRITHDSATAEDIVQEAFLAIWIKAASYQEQQGSVRTWIQAIVHHRAVDRVRAAVHRDGLWTSLQAESEQNPSGEAAEVWEEAWRNERSLLIHSVLQQLPKEQRQVIELGYFAGYTHTEIAEHWHIPLGTVKGRMRLGLQKMKQLLREYGVETAW
jgi:RNA polymerase sigma-70 factor, ECF subfamily